MDDRGMSEAIGTILNLFVLMIFITGLFAGLNTSTQGAEIAQRQQLDAEAQKVSGQLATVDRLVRGSESTGQIGRHITLSDRIGNQRYTITIEENSPGEGQVVLKTASSNMEVSVPFAMETPANETTVDGGDIYIVRKAGEDSISIISEE